MVLTGILMMGSIQKERYIVGVDCVNLVKSLDCKLLEISEKSREKEYYWTITK